MCIITPSLWAHGLRDAKTVLCVNQELESLLEVYYGAAPVDAASRAAIETQLLSFRSSPDAWSHCLHWLESR